MAASDQVTFEKRIECRGNKLDGGVTEKRSEGENSKCRDSRTECAGHVCGIRSAWLVADEFGDVGRNVDL